MHHFTRRGIVKATLALAAYSAVPAVARASLPASYRALSFYNTHTGESLNTVYWEKGKYIPEAMNDINHVLRDHRTGDVTTMDPGLMDILARLHTTLGSKKPFEVISGYRSPKSNAMMHEHSHGVAKNSMHMYGKAIDIRLTDRSLSSLHEAALAMAEGGVGYYPSSDFVHVDTGRVRRW
jgi:uncharacterized protein YcbK (DUF882 family)